MNTVDRETFRLWSQTEGYRERTSDAKHRIQELIKNYRCYVAYSGGKDSTVLLHMALQADPDITVWHWDYGPYYMPRELEHEVISNAYKIGAHNVMVHTTSEYNEGRKDEIVFFKNLFSWVAETMSEAHDCCLLGLRAEESCRRRRKTRVQFRQIKSKKYTLFEAYPIYQLTARDIWAYIVSHDLPYCSHYDRYGEILGIENVRFSTFFDPEMVARGVATLDNILMPEFKNPEK